MTNRCTRAMLCRAALALAFGVAATVAAPVAAEAQSAPESGPQRATRAELAGLVAQLQQQVATGQMRGDRLNRAQASLVAMQTRLRDGDFKVGDRFVLTLRHDVVRSDTASVRDSLLVAVSALPDFSAAGILRSELDEKLNAHVSMYLKNTTVRTNVLTRITIMGAVRSPGSYYAPPDRPLSDLVMIAGGPASNANLNEIELVRGRTTLLSSKDSRDLLKDGRTLEQVDVQSGDEVRIAAKRARPNFQQVFQLFFIVSSLFFTVVRFLQWYYSRQDA